MRHTDYSHFDALEDLGLSDHQSDEIGGETA